MREASPAPVPPPAVPWLLRRLPYARRLESNPIFLRESGRRYGRRGWLGAAETRTVLGLVAAGALLMAVAAFWGYVPALLALAILILMPRFYLPGRLATVDQLARHLRFEWDEGRLAEYRLTRLGGAEILWGYCAAILLRRLRVEFYLTAAALVFIISRVSAGTFRSDVGIGFQIGFAFFLCLGAVVAGAHLMLLRVASSMGALEAQIESIGAPLGDRVSMGCGFTLARNLIYLFVMPGAIAGAALLQGLYYRGLPLSEPVRFLLAPLAVTLGYAAINLPVAAALARDQIRILLEDGDAKFDEAALRLAELELRRAEAGSSRA